MVDGGEIVRRGRSLSWYVEVAYPNHSQKERPMKECHEFDFEASAGLKKLQELVTQRFSLAVEEAGEQFEEFERKLMAGVLRLGAEILRGELERLDVDNEGVIVEGERFRQRSEKTVGCYDSLFGVIELQR